MSEDDITITDGTVVVKPKKLWSSYVMGFITVITAISTISIIIEFKDWPIGSTIMLIFILPVVALMGWLTVSEYKYMIILNDEGITEARWRKTPILIPWDKIYSVDYFEVRGVEGIILRYNTENGKQRNISINNTQTNRIEAFKLVAEKLPLDIFTNAQKGGI